VHKSAVLGPDVVVGENCVVAEGVRLQKTCLFKGVKVGGHSWVDNSIIGWNSTVGQWVIIIHSRLELKAPLFWEKMSKLKMDSLSTEP
jgi:NDP-sugar pyrophosphorylase family protein